MNDLGVHLLLFLVIGTAIVTLGVFYSDAEDAPAQLLLKTVHDREHDDQRHHPERDAEHRDQCDHGDEMVAAFGPRVAQADEELEGLQDVSRAQGRGSVP